MYKKKFFGDDHEILYGTVINHDAYAFLHITLEVPRGQDTESIIVFNGKEVGKIVVVRNGTKVTRYMPFRKIDDKFVLHKPDIHFRELGRAVASVITDYV